MLCNSCGLQVERLEHDNRLPTNKQDQRQMKCTPRKSLSVVGAHHEDLNETDAKTMLVRIRSWPSPHLQNVDHVKLQRNCFFHGVPGNDTHFCHTSMLQNLLST